MESNSPVHKRFKKQDGESAPRLTLSLSTITINALSIVLQYWMIPNLGWNVEVLRDLIPSIRHKIIELNVNTNDSQQNNRYSIEHLSQSTVGFIDIPWITTLKQQLQNVSIDELFRQLRVSNDVPLFVRL